MISKVATLYLGSALAGLFSLTALAFYLPPDQLNGLGDMVIGGWLVFFLWCIREVLGV